MPSDDAKLDPVITTLKGLLSKVEAGWEARWAYEYKKALDGINLAELKKSEDGKSFASDSTKITVSLEGPKRSLGVQTEKNFIHVIWEAGKPKSMTIRFKTMDRAFVLLEGYDSSVQTLFEALEGFSQSGPQSMGKSGADSSPDRAAVLPVEQKAMPLRESMNKDMGSLLKELRDFIVDMKDENVQPYLEMLNFLGNSEFLQTLLVYNENVLRNNLVRRYPENTAITMVTNQHLFCQTSEYQIDLRPVSIPESRLEIVLTKLGSMSETTLDTKTDAQIRQSGLSVEKFKKLSSTLVKLQRTMQVFPEIK